MSSRKVLRRLHLTSTVWFILCLGYVLAVALREAGFDWWVIFSLSGPSAVLMFLLVSVYLFALFRGAGKAQQIEVEHPLTTTNYYMAFYTGAPLLGALAGCVGMVGVQTVGHFLLGTALGTLLTTFVVWVILDPITGSCEMMLPQSRKHRAERLAIAEAQRRDKQERRERLLAEILSQEQSLRVEWQQTLRHQAERLAVLLETSAAEYERAEREAVDIGATAWQIGGIGCMRELRNMAIAIASNRRADNVADYIAIWWDGIGSWRKPSLG